MLEDAARWRDVVKECEYPTCGERPTAIGPSPQRMLIRGLAIRFGSLADAIKVILGVLFTPESRRDSHRLACPLWATKQPLSGLYSTEKYLLITVPRVLPLE